MSFDRVVIVTKPTPLSGLVKKFGTVGQARFVVEASGAEFEPYLRYDETYKGCLDYVRTYVNANARYSEVDWSYLPTYQFFQDCLVVTVGPDGLVANCMKYLDGQPVFAVNPDPSTIDGVLATHRKQGVVDAIVQPERYRSTQLTMAEARLADGQTLLALNDLFIGRQDHISARYVVSFNERIERQSSSGIIVSTGAGSSGWRRSVVRGASAMLETLGLDDLAQELDRQYLFPRDSYELRFAVREPFVSVASRADLIYGRVTPIDDLVVTSEMPEGGVIFSDGVPSDYLSFCSGSTATIGIAGKRGVLLV